MRRFAITSKKDLQDVLIVLDQLIEASDYRSFCVSVECMNNTDEGVFVQHFSRYSFDVADINDAFEMFSDQVEFGLSWSYDVAIYFLETGPKFETALAGDGVGAPAGAP